MSAKLDELSKREGTFWPTDKTLKQTLEVLRKEKQDGEKSRPGGGP